jgi:hypothetical protein
MKTSRVARSLVITLFVWTTQVHADDVNGAAKAFSQAQEAMLGGDAARAADLYELADELAPSAPALRNAARARLTAGHLAMAATNAAALLRRYPSDKESRDIAEAILSRLTPQLAQLEITCTAACTLTIDGKAIVSAARTQHSLFTTPGARTIAAEFDDKRKASSQITAVPDHVITVQLEAPAKPVVRKIEPAPPGSPVKLAAAPSHGISRWWVAGGGVVTLGLGAATALSGMATLSTRDDIRGAAMAGQDANARKLYNTGRDQQIRTNVLLGATGVAAVGTAMLAVFANWSGRGTETNLAVVPHSDRVSFVYGGQF